MHYVLLDNDCSIRVYQSFVQLEYIHIYQSFVAIFQKYFLLF